MLWFWYSQGMVANIERRQHLLNAGVDVLGGRGARGLTHRAVDDAAGVPRGTCANYFESRGLLLRGIAERVFERLAPEPDRLKELEQLPAESAQQGYLDYVWERLQAERSLPLALIEIRLEAARNPDVAELVTPLLRAGFEADVAFHAARGLSGGADQVLVLHHFINGLLLDQLTIPIAPTVDPKQVLAALAASYM